jgi:UDP-N-acetylglucosamine--N-acetylmuramyl-(pentapeptide) pyrophosphoryl-undecaprenol N-acetylglucosamine transferase
MSDSFNILIACGPTGGHIFPAIAVSEEIKRLVPKTKIVFITKKCSLTLKILKGKNFVLRFIHSESIMGKGCLGAVKSFVINILAVIESFYMILRFSPKVVVGMGGYVSGPVVMAAKIFNKPTIIHESDFVPGLSNRMLARFCDEVLVSFKETRKYFKRLVDYVGNPVREDILNIKKNEAASRLKLDPQRKTILIFGGSQGAHAINMAIKEIVPKIEEILNGWQIIHITGSKDIDNMKNFYQKIKVNVYITDFLKSIGDAYALADLIVARGGSAITEITAIGVPGIYIPYPYSAGSHQEYNINWLVEHGAGILVRQDENFKNNLLNNIKILLSDDLRRESVKKACKRLGKPNAARIVAEKIINMT